MEFMGLIIFNIIITSKQYEDLTMLITKCKFSKIRQGSLCDLLVKFPNRHQENYTIALV